MSGKLQTYTVIWEIQVWASSHEEAAKQALEIQQDKDSTGTIFEVALDDDLRKRDALKPYIETFAFKQVDTSEL